MSDIRLNVKAKVTKDKSDTISKAKAIAKEMDNINKESKSISENIKDVFNKNAAIGWAKVIKDTFNFMLKATEKQTEYIENLNMMQVAFGDSAKAAENYIQKLSSATGFDQSGLTKQLGIFRQISSAMGYTSQMSDLLSTNLSKLSLDISSLYNVSTERAGKALESAITGQVRSIRSLTGADITQATLQQEAYTRGINKSVTEMTRAEKTILIYLSLERQLANANGDLSRTINSVANQTKIFKDQIFMAGRQLGSFFIPILKSLLPILNGVLMAFNTITGALLGFFGIDASSMAKEFGVASSGLDEIEMGLDGINKAGKEAKKSLRGFDKLNNITTPTSASGGAGAGGIGFVDNNLKEALKEYNLQLDKMRNKATEIRDRILDWLGFSKQVNGQWEWSAGTLLKNIWDWWSKLNVVAKVFVTLGAVKVITGIYNGFKKLASLLKSTKLYQSISLIAESIGKKGLAGTITELNNAYGNIAIFLEALIGIVATVDGIIKLKDAFKSLSDEGANIQNVTGIILGLVEVLSGLSLVFGAITGNATAITAGIIGIGAAFGGQFLLDVTNAKDKTQELYDQLNSEIWKDLAIYQRVQELSTELENYMDKNGKVQKSDEDRVNYILNQLNDAYGTEYELINGLITENGKVVTSYQKIEKEIDNYMAKMKAQLILQKYKEQYTVALEKEQEKTQLLKVANDNYQETLAYIEEQKKNLIEAGYSEAEAEKFANEQREIAARDYQKQLKDIETEYKNYIDLKNQYEALEQASYKNDLEGMKTLTTEIIGNQVKVSESAIQEVNKVADTTNNTIKNNFGEMLWGMKKQAYDEMTNIAKSMNSAMDYHFKTNYKVNVDAKLNYSNSLPTMKAEGGFVNSGEIYIARENGLSEYIGSFGNKTAVANNDQIVEGITVGVARGMAAAQKDTNVVIEATGDASGLLNFINFEQKKKERQYGLG